MKPIERKVILQRNRLIKNGRKIFANAIRQQYQQAINTLENSSFDDMVENLRGAITDEPIQKVYAPYYSSAADIALTWRKYHMRGRKSLEDDLYTSKFMRSLHDYGIRLGKSRIKDITTTTEENIIRIVQEQVTYALTEGTEIDSARRNIMYFVNQQYEEITMARAQLIAQTEMIAASNQAAMEGTASTGLEFRKFWSTSGIGNSRESHMEAEADSIAVGGYMENEAFSNGLQFPGDPAGGPEEVCNCHCTLLTEII